MRACPCFPLLSTNWPGELLVEVTEPKLHVLPKLHHSKALLGVRRLGRKDANSASDAPMATPGDVHIQDTGLDSTTIAAIMAGWDRPTLPMQEQTTLLEVSSQGLHILKGRMQSLCAMP